MTYWSVGAAHNNTDVSKDFLDQGIWFDGYAEDGDDRNRSTLEKVSIGDILLMKSSSTKGANHSITFTKLKGVGRVVSKDDYYSFKMKWLDIKELPLDFDGISYRKTIEDAREDEMLKFAEKIIEKENQKMTINLLKYKHQIILQGPPGTGKTRLAKLLADELTKPNSVGNPMDIINNFFLTFDSTNEQTKLKRENQEKLLSDFQQKFSIDNLKNLILDDYCAGKGDRNNFCWWIETGLKALGKYSPGSARSYLIYWSKEDKDYRKHGKLLRDIESDEEAIQKIADLLSQVVISKKPDVALEYFGDSFLLKILNSYFPSEFFPINGRESLDNALKLFGVNAHNSEKFEKNKKLNELFVAKKAEYKVDVTSFEFMRFLFDNFNLKTGEDIDNNQTLLTKGESKLIQFHPAYAYEDFVRGIVAETTENGNISYTVENKILAEFAQKAKDNPNGNYVLIIDEINRANLPSVLGELIYALEYRNEPVTSVYEFEGEREITLTKNLFVIGTMNTADRSVGHIDYAIRRRFAFVDVLPDENIIQNPTAKILFNSIKTLFSNEFLSPDFKPKDVMIGHSYFLVKDEDELRLKLQFEIKPILREYLKDGIFLETANEKIESLNV
ncbi:MAG: AAA family ATPase [Flavobacterium sp.]|nr:AAA family ATPase [Flavobacterium sp.]